MMEKVLIIGNSGAGKTTFAKALANETKLPLVHLDKIYWCGVWEHRTREEFDVLLQEELEKERWIIDGNFDRTLPQRLRFCDTVFWLDLPIISCLWGATKRVFESFGKSRDDMGGCCVERFDRHKFALYKSIIAFNRKNRKRYKQLLCECKDVNIIVFKSRRQVTRYLNNLK